MRGSGDADSRTGSRTSLRRDAGSRSGSRAADGITSSRASLADAAKETNYGSKASLRKDTEEKRRDTETALHEEDEEKVKTETQPKDAEIAPPEEKIK